MKLEEQGMGQYGGVYIYQVTFLIFTLVKEGVPALLACRVVLSFVSLHASMGRVAFFFIFYFFL